MNCKQGDLAIVVRSSSGLNLGKIVRCLERFDGPWIGNEYFPGWRIDATLIDKRGRTQNVIADEALRPIRDNEERDETIAWAGKPEKVGA